MMRVVDRCGLGDRRLWTNRGGGELLWRGGVSQVGSKLAGQVR